MKTAKYLYKCKNCGKKFEHGSVSNVALMNMNFYHILNYGCPMSHSEIGDPPGPYEVHHCGDGVTGVAELVAVIEKD